MLGRLALLFALVRVSGLAGEGFERSPYGLAGFVASHEEFEWETVWRGLGIDAPEVPMQKCTSPSICSCDLVTVRNPNQVVAILGDGAGLGRSIVRFRREVGGRGWLVDGAFGGFVRYYPPRHRFLRAGTKPFLVVNLQGASGSDWASEVEAWIDLSLPKLRPVLYLTTVGHYSGLPDRIGLETRMDLLYVEPGPVERIHVRYRAVFTRGGKRFSSRSDRVVYRRDGIGFTFDAARSRAAEEDIVGIYEFVEGRPTDAEYLRYLRGRLRGIASGAPSDDLDWLRRFLPQCVDTAEKRELEALLQGRSSSPGAAVRP